MKKETKPNLISIQQTENNLSSTQTQVQTNQPTSAEICIRQIYLLILFMSLFWHHHVIIHTSWISLFLWTVLTFFTVHWLTWALRCVYELFWYELFWCCMFTCLSSIMFVGFPEDDNNTKRRFLCGKQTAFASKTIHRSYAAHRALCWARLCSCCLDTLQFSTRKNAAALGIWSLIHPTTHDLSSAVFYWGRQRINHLNARVCSNKN